MSNYDKTVKMMTVEVMKAEIDKMSKFWQRWNYGIKCQNYEKVEIMIVKIEKMSN